MTSAKAVILEAAAGLLNHSGIDSVTVRNVAEASNYGRSTVSHHFRDKDRLFDALHLVALEAFSLHVTHARFGPSFAPENAQTQDELRNLITGEVPEGTPVEAGIQVYRRFHESNPGYWEILRFRRCPDFESNDAPAAWKLMMVLCDGKLEAPAGATVDLIVHQLLSLHEWISKAKPEAVMRILHSEPSLNYWISSLR